MGGHHLVTVTSLHHFLLLFLLLGFLYLESNIVGGLSEITVMSCKEGERKALLDFKAALTDTSGRLSSWIGDDCCAWTGVGCNKNTGHVIKLDLRRHQPTTIVSGNGYGYATISINGGEASLGGNISPSLLKLKHLHYLDLSVNNFQGTYIPDFIGSLENLRYLDLSNALFTGTIPPHFGNLSRLEYLDLHSDHDVGLTINNFQWLSGLSSLRYLNMNYVSFTGKSSTDWIQSVTMLPSLSELHLSHSQLSNIPFSLPLANFTSLLVLELSGNNFNSSIPPWLFNIATLTVLDLSQNNLHGPVPDTFANTSSLQNLDISNTSIRGKIPSALGNLCNLKRLDLSRCSNINGEITEYVNSVSMCNSNSLETLHLGSTEVSGLIPSSMGNLSSLIELDLSSTRLSGPIPASLGSLLSLNSLVLKNSKISGSIPASIGNLSSLRTLDLSQTQIKGPIPMSIGGLSSLRVLDLSNNQMDATIPESIGELSELVELRLSGSSLRGVVSEYHFKNAKSIRLLDMGLVASDNPLLFKVGMDWIPTFSLAELQMSNLQMGPKFPSWIATQKELSTLNLTNVGISDTISDGFWNLCARQRLTTLDLSHNQIRGRVPNSLGFFGAFMVDLSFNQIEGSFPLWSNVSFLYLGKNLFTGQIPQNIGEVLGSAVQVLQILDFSGNFLNGSIPSSICGLTSLAVISLSNNSLQGELPTCWKDMKGLQFLDLADNNLSGKIPQSLGSLSSLQFLILSSNNFHGKIPSSLRNCPSLYSLDLGRNGLSGNIPTWIGENQSYLQIIRLRSNFLTGKIPSQLCNLPMLHFLDFSHNTLSGFIPKCFGDLNALKTTSSTGIGYEQHMTVVTKGREYEYSSTLNLVKSIDLSRNQISGKIPDEITRLVGLGILNLSMNHLTGNIPEKIGDLQNLETLDLSINQLSGQIPSSITSLTFLSHLNLSHNNLSGKIPSSTQLQTIGDASIYTGNPELCGLPLANYCPGTSNMSPPPTYVKVDGENEEWMDMLWFYIGIIMGFIVGFWSVWGVLFFKKSWRIAYFRFWSSC